MKIDRTIYVLLTILFVAFAASDAKASFTVATFADPSNNSNNPLFNVNFSNDTITGGWADSKTGLTLQVPVNGHTFNDAWFRLVSPTGAPSVSITNEVTMPWGKVGQTGPGRVEFYANNTSTNPLIVVDFSGGVVSMSNFGAQDELTANTVTITGSEISGILTQEEFSFSFANTIPMTGNTEGFTATSSFTSSASVPEPATIGSLCLGALLVSRKRKNK